MRKIKVFFAAMALLLCSAAFAQNITVKGQITDASTGETIPFAAVQLKGTTTGVASDVDGNYTISVPANGSLVFSSVGYVTAEVAVAGKAVQNVALNPDSQALEGVVVTAQGLTRKEKSLGYSTVQIAGEDLTIARQTDLGQSLAGKVSGARFFSTGGTTFDSGKIVLRGTTGYTDRTGSEPIYVVDGTITNKNAVNMDDVESINVLKGPAATALYGSQGGNGAVIITTKSAKAGETHVEFTHTTQMETYYNHFHFQKLYGGGSTLFDTYYNDWYGDANASTSAAYLLGEVYGQTNPDGSYYLDYYSDENWGPRYDDKTMVATALYYDPTSSHYQKAEPWSYHLNLKDLYKTGWSNTSNVAFSKAGQGYNLRFSYTEADRTGIVDNSDATRRYFTAKSMIQATPWLRAVVDYKFTYRKNHNAQSSGYSEVTNPLCDFLQWGQTNVNLKDYKNDWERPDGSWRTWNIIGNDNLAANFHDIPYGVYKYHNYYDTLTWNVLTGDVEASLPFNIKLGVNVSGNLRNEVTETMYSEGSINFGSHYAQSQNFVHDMTYKGRITWGDTFINDRLAIDAAAFVEQENYDYGTLSGSAADGLSINNYFNLAASVGPVNASNSKTQYKTRAVYGNVTLAFDDTYFIDANIRNDWDSRLPSANNSYLYGGLSASLMLSNFINAKWLNFWKLRASAAQVGSTLGAYATTYVYTASTKYGSTGTQYQSTTQLNQSIKPTISTSYEVGTEFRMFGNRLHGDINWYNRDTKNQILNADVPAHSGYASRQLNAGLIRNRGIEFEIGGTAIRTKDIQWDLDFNIAKNVNTLVELTEGMDSYLIGWNKFYYEFGAESKIGEPVGALYTGARFKRNDNGELVLRKNGKYSWGDYQPLVDTEKKYVGNFQPDWIGGFATSFTWRNWTAAASLDFQIGGQIFSWDDMWAAGSGLSEMTAALNDKGVNVREPLSKGGGVKLEGVDETTGEHVSCYVNPYQYFHYKANYDNDAWMYDRTYVKLREVSIGYNLPKKVISNWGIGLTSASISLVATNPWLIYSACPNFDPSEAGSEYVQGGQTPSTRTFGATIKLTF